MNLEIISSILADFGDAPVLVQAEHCLNRRHKGASCQLCVDTCPTEAIRLQAGRPHLNAEGCVNCGLCVHACPTEVFTQQNAPEAILTRTVSLLPDEAVALVCPRHDHPTPTRVPVSTVVRHKRCLGSLSVPQLLELTEGGRRAIWLDDTRCAACPIGHVQPAIVRAAETANRLLQAFDRPPAIRTPRENPDMLQDEPAPRSVIHGDRPAVSRRGFFSALGHLTRKTATSAAAGVLPKPGTDSAARATRVDQRLPHRIPPARARLYMQLKRLGEPAEGGIEAMGLPYADVRVNAAVCSACGLCARFCPTGALEFVRDEDRFTLGFWPALCLDCDVCVQACPERAIRLADTLAAGDCIAVYRRTLAQGQLIKCTGCGDATANRDGAVDAPRCYSCRARGGPAVPIRDTTGLFADLEKQLSSNHPHRRLSEPDSSADLSEDELE